MLAISAPAWALTLPPGPMQLNMLNWDMGAVYASGHVATDGAAVDLLPQMSPISPVVVPGEDGWFVFKITDIVRDDGSGTIVWAEGTTELVGIGYGTHDVGVDTHISGLNAVLSENTSIKMWEQPVGSFSPLLGSSGRTGVDAYTGIGTPGGVAGATLIAELADIVGAGPPNNVGGVGAPLAPGLLAAPTVPFSQAYLTAGTVGVTNAYFDAIAGQYGDDILGNGEAESYPYVDPYPSGAVGDNDLIMAEFHVYSNLEPYIQVGANDDWFFASHDPVRFVNVVPEPLTMCAVFGSLVGLGGYIRKRRTA